MRAMRQSKGCAEESKAVLTHSTPKLFPLASELQGALADGFAEGLVGRDGVEPFGLRLVLTLQPTSPRNVGRFTCYVLNSLSFYHPALHRDRSAVQIRLPL